MRGFVDCHACCDRVRVKPQLLEPSFYANLNVWLNCVGTMGALRFSPGTVSKCTHNGEDVVVPVSLPLSLVSLKTKCFFGALCVLYDSLGILVWVFDHTGAFRSASRLLTPSTEG